jgi:hypothetical protein
LHELLLAVVRERERESEHAVEYDEAYSPDHRSADLKTSPPDSPRDVSPSHNTKYLVEHVHVPLPFTRSTGGRSPRNSQLLSRSIAHTQSPSVYDCAVLTETVSPTAYSPSSTGSPGQPSVPRHISRSPDTELDTLVFASPSCTPPARTLKRPRSLSITGVDSENFYFNRKLQKTSQTPFPTLALLSPCLCPWLMA